MKSDPEELNDIAKKEPQLVQELDAYLTSIVGDYYSLDKVVVKNDVGLYKKFFVDKYDNQTLRKKLEKAYRGFDDDDWEK